MASTSNIQGSKRSSSGQYRGSKKVKGGQVWMELKMPGILSLISHPEEFRQGILMREVSQFLLLTTMKAYSPLIPRWCNFESPNEINLTSIIIVDGYSKETFSSLKSCNRSFFENKQCFEVLLQEDLYPNIALVPCICSEGQKLLEVTDNFRETLKKSVNITEELGQYFPIANQEIRREDKSISDVFDRTLLLQTPIDMKEDGYPVSLRGKRDDKFGKFIMTKEEYVKVTPKSPIFSIDCEMCLTSADQMELTHICVVDENLQIVYEAYVKPTNPVVDYLTAVTGITEETLKDVSTTLTDVQKCLIQLLPKDAILVGQSLNNDLVAINMKYAFCIELTRTFCLSKDYNKKSNLALLTKMFLGETIQSPIRGHSASEDALATMKLLLLKLSKGLFFSDSVLSDIKPVSYCDSLTYATYLENQKGTSVFGRTDSTTKLLHHVSYILEHGKATFGNYVPETLNTESQASFISTRNVNFHKLQSNDQCITQICREMQGKSFKQLLIGFLDIEAETDLNSVQNQVIQWLKNVWNNSPENSSYNFLFMDSKHSNSCVLVCGIKKGSWL